MIYYSSASIYIEKATSLTDKIVRVENIIESLMSAAANSAGGEGISEYSLNDGQSVVKTVYRGSESIFKAIHSFERLKNMYSNKLNGRRMRLIDGKSFPNSSQC